VVIFCSSYTLIKSAAHKANTSSQIAIDVKSGDCQHGIMKRICLISEVLVPPFDEGMKIFTWQLARYLDDHFEFLALTNGTDPVPEITAKNVKFGKGLVSRSLRQNVIGLQPRTLAWWGRAAAQLAQPLDVFVQSNKSVRDLAKIGIEARAIPSGVDPSRFHPISGDARVDLRKRY
jgi:hypothetical protein